MKKILFSLILACSLPSLLVSCGDAKDGVLPKKEMAIQLYSMRDTLNRCGTNYMPVLEQLASWGYTAVEAANYNNGLFYGTTPEEFKANVEKAGMKVLSSHVGHNLNAEEVASHDFGAALDWWKKCIADHKAAGMKYIVNPGMGVPATLADLQTQCDFLNEVGKLCAAEGIKFGYHSHSHEYRRVEGKVMYDYMIEHTDPQYVFFQMDVYWAVVGGVAPVEYFERYPGRFTLLHIKDRCTLGESGMLGFDAIFNHADVAGLKGFVVEVECDPYPSVEESAAYIRKAPFVKASYN